MAPKSSPEVRHAGQGRATNVGARVSSGGTPDKPRTTLRDFARTDLMFGPSPVHRLPRLTEHLGGTVDIWAKREDCNSGLAYGGNKVRKLEYLVAEALA